MSALLGRWRPAPAASALGIILAVLLCTARAAPGRRLAEDPPQDLPAPPEPAPPPAAAAAAAAATVTAAALPPDAPPAAAALPAEPAVETGAAGADAFAADAAAAPAPEQELPAPQQEQQQDVGAPAAAVPGPPPPAPAAPPADPFAVVDPPPAQPNAADHVVTASSEPPTSTTLQPDDTIQPEDIPAEVASLYTSAPAPQATAASANGQGQRGGAAQGSAPRPKIGTLTSLLNPPPGFSMPPLSDQAKANIPQLQKLRQGLATVVYMRAVSNYDGTTMNCGLGYLNDHFKDFFVGIPQSLYRGGELCGLCVRMWCVDSVCADPLVRNDTLMVTDSCKDCQGNNLVVSARGMAALSGVDFNNNPSLQVAWEFAPCGGLIQGGIKLLPSDDNSPVFLGLNFSNLQVLLKAVKLNGLDMSRTSYGFWVIDTPGKNIPLRPPYGLELLGVNNQRLTKRLATLNAQDLGVNFA